MMKKTYSTPSVKLIDFCYDEQVVASSSATCNNYSLVSKENPEQCFDYLKDIKIRTFSDCFYTDKE